MFALRHTDANEQWQARVASDCRRTLDRDTYQTPHGYIASCRYIISFGAESFVCRPFRRHRLILVFPPLNTLSCICLRDSTDATFLASSSKLAKMVLLHLLVSFSPWTCSLLWCPEPKFLLEQMNVWARRTFGNWVRRRSSSHLNSILGVDVNYQGIKAFAPDQETENLVSLEDLLFEVIYQVWSWPVRR